MPGNVARQLPPGAVLGGGPGRDAANGTLCFPLAVTRSYRPSSRPSATRATSVAINGVTFTGISGNSPAVAGQFADTGQQRSAEHVGVVNRTLIECDVAEAGA